MLDGKYRLLTSQQFDVLELYDINKDPFEKNNFCLLYTSDAADDLLCVDLGGRRIITKKTTTQSIH